MTRRSRLFALCLAPVLAAACGQLPRTGFGDEASGAAEEAVDDAPATGSTGGTGGTGGTGEGGTPTTEAPPVVIDPNAPVTLCQVQATIFDPLCTRCHSAGQVRPNLTAAAVIGQTVGDSIVVGDPDRSLLFRLVTGAASPRMPLGGPDLNADQIELVRRWIADGALPCEPGSEIPSDPPPPGVGDGDDDDDGDDDGDDDDGDDDDDGGDDDDDDDGDDD